VTEAGGGSSGGGAAAVPEGGLVPGSDDGTKGRG
jgi:hypothetical protein